MAATGVALLSRVRAPLLPRDPYRFFTDGGWGVVYALHGLAGLSLVALVIIHVYFALRPEKRPITLAMEPLRGGNLGLPTPPPAVAAIWAEAKTRRTPVAWALRWVWNHPEATVVLSGMGYCSGFWHFFFASLGAAH